MEFHALLLVQPEPHVTEQSQGLLTSQGKILELQFCFLLI